MRRAGLITLFILLAGAAVALGAGSQGATDYESASGLRYTTVKPTGVGLPQIGATGTVGAGDMSSALRDYHDSGRYDTDLAVVAKAATAYLDKRLDQNAKKARRVRRCKVSFRKTGVTVKGRRLYRRVKKCRRPLVTPPRLHGKPAIVLDIDETSLSNWDGLNGSNFSSTGTVGPAALGTGTALAPILGLYRDARSRGVAVFFVTGRPPEIKGQSESNLSAQGYDSWDGLYMKPTNQGTQAYKAGVRGGLEQKGWDIVANVGDQESDLDGGHADRGFKLPNPFYFISD